MIPKDLRENEYIKEILYMHPTEKDIESFQNWKKIKRKKALNLNIFILIMLIVIGIILFPVFLEEKVVNKVFGIISYMAFVILDIYLMNQYFKMRLWKMEKCNYGTIVDKYRSFQHSGDAKPNRSAPSVKNTTGHIIVLVDGKKLSINTCTNDEYKMLKVNDEVIIFLCGDNRRYIIKK